ncbi:MAG: Uma2 family endonuclease [Pirellulaceae bacterium]
MSHMSRERLPGGVFPRQLYPELSPNLVVEVLSPVNTKAEMSRKRLEYFHAGVEVVWIVDCVNRSVAVYTSPSSVKVFGEHDTVDCTQALPGFSSPVASFLPTWISASSKRNGIALTVDRRRRKLWSAGIYPRFGPPQGPHHPETTGCHAGSTQEPPFTALQR